MTDKSLKDKAINYKGSDYVQVKDRVLYLAENYDGRYTIEQDYEYFAENKMWVVKTTLIVWDEGYKHSSYYTGLAQEIEGTNFINSTSCLENCATSSLGRAIACMGIGVIDSFASMNEIEKAENRSKTQDTAKDGPSIDKNNLPRFNDPDYEKLKAETEWMKEKQTSDELIKSLETKYRLSKAMKQKVAELRASLD